MRPSALRWRGHDAAGEGRLVVMYDGVLFPFGHIEPAHVHSHIYFPALAGVISAIVSFGGGIAGSEPENIQ